MRERFDGLPLPELVISAVGMILVLNALENGLSPVRQQNPAHLIMFVSVCALGAVATLFPRRCSPEIRVTGDLHPSRYTDVLGIRVIHGHHSDCSGFSNHEIRLGEKRICAGCLGLLAGSLIAIIITVTQAIQSIPVPPQSGPLGLAFVAAGLAYSSDGLRPRLSRPHERARPGSDGHQPRHILDVHEDTALPLEPREALRWL